MSGSCPFERSARVDLVSAASSPQPRPLGGGHPPSHTLVPVCSPKTAQATFPLHRLISSLMQWRVATHSAIWIIKGKLCCWLVLIQSVFLVDFYFASTWLHPYEIEPTPEGPAFQVNIPLISLMPWRRIKKHTCTTHWVNLFFFHPGNRIATASFFWQGWGQLPGGKEIKALSLSIIKTPPSVGDGNSFSALSSSYQVDDVGNTVLFVLQPCDEWFVSLSRATNIRMLRLCLRMNWKPRYGRRSRSSWISPRSRYHRELLDRRCAAHGAPSTPTGSRRRTFRVFFSRKLDKAETSLNKNEKTVGNFVRITLRSNISLVFDLGICWKRQEV